MSADGVADGVAEGDSVGAGVCGEGIGSAACVLWGSALLFGDS